MRHIYSLKFLLLCLPLVFSGFWLQGQVTISTVSTTPAVPLECQNLDVTVTGQNFCANYVFIGSNANLVGTTLDITIDYQVGLICLPAIVPYTQVVSVGLLPAGAYTMNVTTFLNGLQSNFFTTTLTVGSCCSVNPTFNVSQAKICLGDSIQFAAADTSIVNYNWKLDGVSVSSNASFSQAFTQAGTFMVEMVGDDGTCADSSSQTIVVSLPQPTPQITNETCPGSMDGSIGVGVNGGVSPYTYTWTNGTTGPNLSQLSGGIYGLVLSDSLGCLATDTLFVQTGPAVAASFNLNMDTIVCTGTTMMFTNASLGSSTYDWQQNGQSFSNSVDAIFPFVNPGNYLVELIASTSNGVCKDTASQTIVVSAPPQLSLNGTDEGCPNSADGSIDLTVSGGISPYTFSWSNGATSEDLNNINGGQYSVTVTDSLGCVSVDSTTLATANGPTASFNLSSPLLICEGTTVFFDNTSVGGNVYTWLSDGNLYAQSLDTSQTYPTAGSYVMALIVSDGFCLDTTEQTIDVASAPNIGSQLTNPTCPPNDTDGAIDLIVSGGTGVYDYDWNTGPTTEDLSNLGPGTYIVTVTDSSNCSVIDTFELVFNGGLTADFDFFTGGNGAQFNDLTDSTAVSWLWTFGDGDSSTDQNPLHFFDFFGTYQVCLTATDQYGCSSTFCDNIEINTAIDPDEVLAARVYPNPSSGLVEVEMPGIRGAEMEFRLYDALGRSTLLHKGPVQPTYTLDLSTYASGVYQLVVQTEKQVFRTKVLRE